MNIKEEISKIILENLTKGLTPKQAEDKLVDLFKQWALECVGDKEAWESINDDLMRQAILRRIEESTSEGRGV